MTVHEAVRRALAEWPGAFTAEGRVSVPTHCLYPSNESVAVIVEGGASEFIVHDDGGAVDEIASIGGRLEKSHKLVGYILRPYGLAMDEHGVIRSPIVPPDQLLGTIILVANASKEVAEDLIQRIRPRSRRSFREDLARLLELKFPKHVVRNSILLGASNKPHKFDHIVRLDENRKLVIDAVVNDPGSINAAVVAHLDVNRAKPQGIEQRIVYDDHERWSSADLSLLKVGARPVAFSRVADVLDKLAA